MVEGAIGWWPIGPHHLQGTFPVEKLPFHEAARRADRPSCAPGVANTLVRGPVPQPFLETSRDFSRATRQGGGTTARLPGAVVTSGLR